MKEIQILASIKFNDDNEHLSQINDAMATLMQYAEVSIIKTEYVLAKVKT